MEHEFWHNAREQGKTGWRQKKYNSRLLRYWPMLELPADAVVLVPLCGDTPDMHWLWQQGHHVVGCDLSEAAIKRFLETHGITATVIEHGEQNGSQNSDQVSGEVGSEVSSETTGTTERDPTVPPVREYRSERLRLISGDFLQLQAGQLGPIDAFYDRAATVALPPPIRARYAAMLASIIDSVKTGRDTAGEMNPGSRLSGLLISMDYDQNQMSGPPFSVPDTEIHNLYGEAFELVKLGSAEGPEILGSLKERGLTTLQESVFKLDGRIPG
ncbi:MAG: hypothetical protein KTR33_00080 [Gammaproteobacteria bacterium]|nr:hypothetical protein [Gammaproteobacteria bacterium]